MAERLARSENNQANSDYLKLPDSLIEASKMRKQNYDHKAMYLIGASIEANRACNEAIIFAYGAMGTGASSTLNHLFNLDMIPTSESQTTTVAEYVSTLESDSWEAKNLRICFINSPGYGDMKGDMQDIMNLAAIEEFISKQRNLGTKFYKCYPNIVLITINANDHRIRGERSNFNNMLNALKQFKLVDTLRPNLVIVLTHAMSIPKGNFNKKVQEQSECIQEIIRTTFGIEGSIVYIENCAESYLLEKDGDWTVLADGTRQPLNLFEAMIKSMINNCDEVGVEAIRLFFRDYSESNPIEGMVVKIGTDNEEIIQRWSRFISHKKLRILDNDCTIEIRNHQRKNPTIPKDDLLPLMSELNRAKVLHPNDIRGKNISDIQKLVWPYQLTVLDKETLIYLFDIQPAQYTQFLVEIGHGCYTNEIMPTATESMFNFINREEPLKIRNGGVYLPDCMEIDFAEDTTVYCYCPTLTKDENLIKGTLTSTIPVSGIKSESFKKKQYTFVFMVTHTVFNLKIDLYKSLSKLPEYLNPELKKSADVLPYDCIVEVTEEGTNCHPLYLEFLKKYGHCLLTHWNGGGIVSGQITVEIFHSDIPKTEGIINNYLRMYFTSSHLIKESYQEELVNSVVETLHNVKLTYKGGIAPLVKGNLLGRLNSIKIEEWKRSLLDYPVPLENIQFSKLNIAIYEIVKQFSDEKCAKLKRVLDIIAPECDIDDRLSEMEAEYFFNDNALFGVNQRDPEQTIEQPATPEHRSRDVVSSSKMMKFSETTAI